MSDIVDSIIFVSSRKLDEYSLHFLARKLLVDHFKIFFSMTEVKSIKK